MKEQYPTGLGAGIGGATQAVANDIADTLNDSLRSAIDSARRAEERVNHFLDKVMGSRPLPPNADPVLGRGDSIRPNCLLNNAQDLEMALTSLHHALDRTREAKL